MKTALDPFYRDQLLRQAAKAWGWSLPLFARVVARSENAHHTLHAEARRWLQAHREDHR